MPLEHLEVALWPEFDRRAMLVIYRFQITADITAPTTVVLPIPIEVGQPHAVAWQDASGALYDAAYSLGPQGIISISIPQGNSGQLEYYADLTLADQLRTFRFEWPGTVALGGFSYQVQEPIGASALSVIPAPEAQGPGPFGLSYATAELGPQAAGSEVVIEVSYQKESFALSLPSLETQSQPLAPTAALEPGSADLLPKLLAGGGLLLIAAGVAYYLHGRASSPPRRRRPARGNQAELEVSAVYCHRCGSKAKVSDSFCRNCGTRLRG